MSTIFDRVKELKNQAETSSDKPKGEVAAKRKNYSKMIGKIVAISQNMGLTEKDWDKIDAGVRKGLKG